MSKTNRCFICDEQFKYRWEFVRHLADKHLEGGDITANMAMVNYRTCWCGGMFCARGYDGYSSRIAQQPSELSTHLYENGGPQTHFLQCKLGVSDDKQQQS